MLKRWCAVPALLMALTGLLRFVTAWYLQGRFKPVETFFREAGLALFPG